MDHRHTLQAMPQAWLLEQIYLRIPAFIFDQVGTQEILSEHFRRLEREKKRARDRSRQKKRTTSRRVA